MMDLNQVRMFVQVVRASSFAAAARRLEMPANTLSRHVRQLEATLETRLMQRSTRKLTLTHAGAAFYDRCAAAVDEVLEAGLSVVGSNAVPSGTIRIAAPADFTDLFAAEWLAQFLTEHPKVRLELLLSDARADLIGERIDVAFRGGTVDESRYVYRRLVSQHLKLVASPAYLKSRGSPRDLPDLVQHDCLVTGPSVAATWALTGPRGLEEAKVSGRVSANTARALLKSCLAGLGIALLPEMLTIEALRTRKLIHVLPQYQRAGAEFCVVLPSREQIPAAVAAFVAFATEKLNAMIVIQGTSHAHGEKAKR